MTYCINCGKEIGGGSGPCDACGRKRPSSTGPLVGGIILGIVGSAFIASMLGDRLTVHLPPTPVATSRPATATAPVAAVPAETPKLVSEPLPAPVAAPVKAPEPTTGKQWIYTQNVDPMSSETTYFASVRSSNTVTFDFPYSGAQRATLTMRTHPRWGKSVIFSIERGQLLCSSYDGCSVLVRFDDEAATKFSANGAADNSTETLFLNNYGRFAEKLLKAKLVRISPAIHQQGNPVFEFDVEGFDVKQYRPE